MKKLVSAHVPLAFNFAIYCLLRTVLCPLLLIADYDELLEKLKKEEELLLSRKTLPSESEAFGDERIPEIIEPYNEEAEKEWRSKFLK